MESGKCQCGCGRTTSVVQRNEANNGYRKGDHRRYIHGHHAFKGGPEYHVDAETGCWLWAKTIDRRGYGVLKRNQEQILAHRFIYERHKGPIPDGLVLDHVKCNNPPCVNPDHLEPVTNAENVRRAVTIKYGELRRRIQEVPPSETNASAAARLGTTVATVRRYRGERESYTRPLKLTPEQVTEIKSTPLSETCRRLAREYGVSSSLIHQIRRNRAYTDLSVSTGGLEI